MDTSQDIHDEGGISRRDLIAKSAVAGGLVWASPVLFSGRAGATIPCCDVGTPYTIKVAEVGGVNCGVSCLSSLEDFNFDCLPDDLEDCFNELELIVGDFTEGGSDTATIHLKSGIGIIAAAVKTSNRCYHLTCNNLATAQNDAAHPNTCFFQNDKVCDDITTPPNRIWVIPGANGGIDVKVATNDDPDGTLNHVELSICVAPEITALCP